MRFEIFVDTGERAEPVGNILIARREAIDRIIGNKRIRYTEIRPMVSPIIGG